MKQIMLAIPMILAMTANTAAKDNTPMSNPSAGRIERLVDFASNNVAARNVDIWLPPGYSESQKYAVLYMQDGQMLFDSAITWNKQEWQADEIAAKLITTGKVQPFIIVGIHNGGKLRNSEYFPERVFANMSEQQKLQVMAMTNVDKSPLFSSNIIADKYLKFLTAELKPYIDNHYSVYTEPANTAIMGSSRGGLISMYAISEYPDVFGSAACLSTHWPIKYDMDDNLFPEVILTYMQSNLPDPATHRIYFDYGTETLDALYPPLQKKADAVMIAKGYSSANWQTREFLGANHSENAWAERLHIPFQFLFPIKIIH